MSDPKPAVELGADVTGWLTVYRQAEAKIAEYLEIKAKARAMIEAALDTAEEGRVEGRPVVRWAWTKSVRRFDSKRLQAELPDVYAEYLKVGEPSRRFTLVDGE